MAGGKGYVHVIDSHKEHTLKSNDVLQINSSPKQKAPASSSLFSRPSAPCLLLSLVSLPTARATLGADCPLLWLLHLCSIQNKQQGTNPLLLEAPLWSSAKENRCIQAKPSWFSDAVDSCFPGLHTRDYFFAKPFPGLDWDSSCFLWNPRGDFSHHLRKAEKELDGSTPYFKITSVSTHLIQQLLKWKFLHYINMHLTKKRDLIPSWHWALTRLCVMKVK